MSNAAHKYPHMKEADFVNTRLSDKGREQAALVRGPVDLLIVSPLRRTLETYVHSKLQVKRLFTTIDLLRAQPETNIGILSHGVFLAELASRIGRPFANGMSNAQVIHVHNAILP